MANPDHPCMVIPGIKGTGLENFYLLPPATTWSAWEALEQTVAGPDFDSLALDAAAEADEAGRVLNQASQLLNVAYGSLVQALRGRSDLPVYLFPYDWRYSNTRSAEALTNYLRALQRKLAKSLKLQPEEVLFDFVCHSMGGLLFRQFLASWGSLFPKTLLPVSRVVFIATPHLGSLDAVEALIRGETVLFGGRKELRKLARTFPAVYELLPRFPNAVVNSKGVALDIFDIKNWQDTVTDQVKDPEDYDVEQAHLTAARDILNNLPDPLSPAFGLKERILVIYGCKPNSTLRQVSVDETKSNWYDFDRADQEKRDGDQVVPVESAQPAGIPSVEVRGEDVPILSLKAHLLPLHVLLPSLDEVSSIVSRFFSGTTGAALLPRGTDPKRYHPA